MNAVVSFTFTQCGVMGSLKHVWRAGLGINEPIKISKMRTLCLVGMIGNDGNYEWKARQ